MKFIHTSDTHIGCEIPIEYKEIRKKDFINAFKQVVDFAIRSKVDFILHSGDLFDSYFRISSEILNEIVDLFMSLRDHDIKFIVIKGNHDTKGHRQKIFELFKKLRLIEEPTLKNPIEISDCLIYGISEPVNIGGEDLTNAYKLLLKNINVKNSEYYKIFVFHGAPDIISKEFYDPRVVPTAYFPKNIDYYALGHFHIKKLLEIENKIFAIPGSTERTEISRKELNTTKVFYYICDKKLKEIPIKTRDIMVIEDILTSEEEIEKITHAIFSRSKETLFKTKLRVHQNIYNIVKNKIERLIDSGYMIIEDITLDSEEISLEMETEKEALEEAFSKLLIDNKSEIFEIFNKIKEYLDDIFQGDSSDIDRLREVLRQEFIDV